MRAPRFAARLRSLFGNYLPLSLHQPGAWRERTEPAWQPRRTLLRLDPLEDRNCPNPVLTMICNSLAALAPAVSEMATACLSGAPAASAGEWSDSSTAAADWYDPQASETDRATESTTSTGQTPAASLVMAAAATSDASQASGADSATAAAPAGADADSPNWLDELRLGPGLFADTTGSDHMAGETTSALSSLSSGPAGAGAGSGAGAPVLAATPGSAAAPGTPSGGSTDTARLTATLASEGALASGPAATPTPAPGPTPAGQATPSTSAAQQAYAQLPLTFEANVGQTSSQVQFVAHASNYTAYLTESGTVLALGGTGPQGVVDLQLVGANPSAPAQGQDLLATRTNYLIGSDPSQWHTDVPNFGQVVYHNVYAGVDMVYHSPGQQQLEYDFRLAPGADPGQIRLAASGAQGLAVDPQGNLVLHTVGGNLVEHAPLLSQTINGTTQPVAGHFVLYGHDQVGFSVGRYDHSRPLIIDPMYLYSTYLGGTSDETGNGIAVDGDGNAYVTGTTASANFPTAGAALQAFYPGAQSAFVTKMNATGTALVWSTFVGGSTGSTFGNALTVFRTNPWDPETPYYNVFVTGKTYATDFPVHYTGPDGDARSLSGPSGSGGSGGLGGPGGPGGGGGWANVWLARLNTQGNCNALDDFDLDNDNNFGWSRYWADSIGGYNHVIGSGYFPDIQDNWHGLYSWNSQGGHTANGIAFDSQPDPLTGRVAIVGGSSDVLRAYAMPEPYIGPENPDHLDDAIYGFFDPSGNHIYDTSRNEVEAHIGGTGYATMGNPPPDNTPGHNVFVGVNFDHDHRVYIAGSTDAYYTGRHPDMDIPIVKPFQGTLGLDANGNSNENAYLLALGPLTNGNYGIGYASFYGGTWKTYSGSVNPIDQVTRHGNPLAVTEDQYGNGYAYLTGSTVETNPSVPNTLINPNDGLPHIQSAPSSSTNAFISKFEFPWPSQPPLNVSLRFSTYLGGEWYAQGSGIVVNNTQEENVTAVYTTGFNGWTLTDNDPTFPITSNALQPALGGQYDAYMNKLAPDGTGTWLYSSFLGGTDVDLGQAIAILPGVPQSTQDQVFVTGATQSPDFPTTPGVFQPNLSQPGPPYYQPAPYDAFVTAVQFP